MPHSLTVDIHCVHNWAVMLVQIHHVGQSFEHGVAKVDHRGQEPLFVMGRSALVCVAQVASVTRAFATVFPLAVPAHEEIANAAKTFPKMPERKEVHLGAERDTGVVSVEGKVHVSVVRDSADEGEGLPDLVHGDLSVGVQVVCTGLDAAFKDVGVVGRAVVIEDGVDVE